ncbi:polycomb group RING finger protein 6-like [Tubulanus polymorphus]|uniref:polycomb group RING finger protein 6-like n=1 Tax=Tubulanus polymorphus TaxID=672921 RepID=UPI003DA48506
MPNRKRKVSKELKKKLLEFSTRSEHISNHLKVIVPPDRKIQLRLLNPYITCQLCAGYLIEAVTITECLHSFCRSCLVKHFYKSLHCPSCELEIHPTNPLSFIKYDRQKQDILAKLLPHLSKEETRREYQFYKERNLPVPEKVLLSQEELDELERKQIPLKRPRLVSIVLEFAGFSGEVELMVEPLFKRYIRVTGGATIKQLKQFIINKLQLSGDMKVHIYCDDDHLSEEFELAQIQDQYCDDQESIIKLDYGISKE